MEKGLKTCPYHRGLNLNYKSHTSFHLLLS